MRTIHKFLLMPDSPAVVKMPRGARPLHVGEQNGNAYVWALVDTAEPETEVLFDVYGTGHPIWHTGRYLGTFTIDHGLVFHVFVRDSEEADLELAERIMAEPRARADDDV